ncbi:MAG: aldo/keto reductase [Anaerolineae bacterium]|nr:aldo/keto reductase [Anaerolineae bacterium]
MEKRRFGRTGHESTVAIFGAAAFWQIEQKEADRVMEMVIDAGINHIDVAPSYGQAELRVSPWMKTERKRFFLGCKTTERTKEGAWREMHESLERLHTASFDLYQCHAVTTFDELDAIFAKGGAIEAMVAAREQGLTKYIGITGHGVDAPKIYLEALRRFDFDSVLFPINFVQMAMPEYRSTTEELISTCKAKEVGTMIIKSITKGPWGDKPKTATTWYEPFDKMDEIQRGIDFVLSHDVTGVCTAGDINILPMVIQACENFTPLNEQEQEDMIKSGSQFEALFK